VGRSGFRQALVRALTGGDRDLDGWPFAAVGLVTSIVSAKGKRLGDMFRRDPT